MGRGSYLPLPKAPHAPSPRRIVSAPSGRAVKQRQSHFAGGLGGSRGGEADPDHQVGGRRRQLHGGRREHHVGRRAALAGGDAAGPGGGQVVARGIDRPHAGRDGRARVGVEVVRVVHQADGHAAGRQDGHGTGVVRVEVRRNQRDREAAGDHFAAGRERRRLAAGQVVVGVAEGHGLCSLS